MTTQSPTDNKRHPSRGQLAQFVNGLLPDDRQSLVEEHVLYCQHCLQRMEVLENDTLSDQIRQSATEYEQLKRPVAQSAIIPQELADHPRYQILEKIGSGGMGDVYRAIHRSMSRPVAIKVLKRHLFENDRAVARFHNEIKVAAQLNHPNIVLSYDAEVTSGMNILVMELVNGRKLSDIVSEKQVLSVSQACRYAIQIACGLAHADSLGTTHRDIKPQNVLITNDGTVKIADFGLAKFAMDKVDEDSRSLTAEGETFGTPDYVAPEQIRNTAAADRRSDIYSLGCTIYFMLTGRPPFVEASVGEKLACHLEKTPPSLASLRPELPADLIGIIERMMHKSPQHRLQTCADVIDDLSKFVNPLTESETEFEAASWDTAIISSGNNLVRSENHQPHRGSRRRIFFFVGLGAALVGLSAVVVSWMPPFRTPTDDTKKIAVVIPANHAWHPEINEVFLYFARQPNVELEWVAEIKKEIDFNNHHHSRTVQPRRLRITRTLDDLTADELDAILFTGGWQQGDISSTAYAFDPALNRQAAALVVQMTSQKKPVAAVGSGITVLAKSGILHGKRAADCQFLRSQDRRDSGAIWAPLQHKPQGDFVRDDWVLTASYSDQLRQLCRELEQILAGSSAR